MTVELDWMAGRFEEHRAHLREVAYRMLGSLSDADDAVQECWLRLSRADAAGVENMRAWLTTVVARVCLNMLRSHATRRADSLDPQLFQSVLSASDEAGLDQEMVLADSVGVALLVVLERLTPAERLAFVLHDMFDLPFEEIAPLVNRTPSAARQLASRARRRVQGLDATPDADLARRREVVEAFLAASRAGDFDALIRLLDPDVVLRVDDALLATGNAAVLRGAPAVVKRAKAFSRTARFCRVLLIDGTPGVVIAPRGHLFRALRFTIHEGRIREIEVVGDPSHLGRLALAVLAD